MKIISYAIILFGLGLNALGQASKTSSFPYKNAKLPLEQRVQDLLGRMTLEEKIGEMTQICASNITLDGTKNLDLNVDKIRDVILKYHVGSFLSGTGKAQRWVDFTGAIQKVAMNETRLGIPVIFGMDNVHGSNYVDEATFLPHNLNMGCTFNAQLVYQGAKLTNIESADLGHQWNFSPVLDVGRNPYWPRLYETFGEDPYWCGQMGSAFIRGTQDCPEIAPYKIAACAKHFIGYSDPKSGWDRTPSEIPDQVIHEMYTPSFKEAFAAGVKTLMVNSGELNGEPVHGSKKILTELLRNQLKFEGVIVTDIKDILKIVEMHGGAHDEKEATLMAIDAGIDMYMACNTYYFCDYMLEFVKSGKISQERIDASVKRILKLKFELGLFENPYPSTKRIEKIGSSEHYKIALQAAQEGLVLLKNKNNLLPLSAKMANLAVLGFAANNKRNLTGPWTLEWLGAEESRQPKNMLTITAALKQQFPKANIQSIDSAQILKHDDFLQLENKINQATHVVISVGEKPYSEFKGNTSDLSLSEEDQKLIQKTASLGKKIILVIVGGRPRNITAVEPLCDAIVFAGIPGTAGGEAIAQLISGAFNPSGKLCFTFPATLGHQVNYNHKKSDKYQPLYPFGYGLSYTQYSYDPLVLSDTLIQGNQKLKVSVGVTNTGNKEGKESVLWFIQDEVGTLTRPVKALKNVEKITLKPMEKKTITWWIDPAKDLSYPNEKGVWDVEKGYFNVQVGGLKGRFKYLIP